MQVQANAKRIYSIDILRGLVMIIMALDHTRDFFTNVPFNPLDLSQTTPQLFFTRWITHYCAPTFVFLSGCSAFLSIQRGKTKKQAAAFLIKRGLWLVFVEIAIINFAFSFDPTYSFIGLQVIWAIGVSMICLAGFVFLRPLHVGLIGLAIILGHNALDGIDASRFGKASFAWNILHQFGTIEYAQGRKLMALYPVLPWIGVMAAGYAFGWVFTLEKEKRSQWLLNTGIAAIVLFIGLRYSNIYGDINKWQTQTVAWKTVCSFINCQKYPPSLLYLLMTLGPSILLLRLFENWHNQLTSIFRVYGSVPFFYYVLHFYIIHLAAVITAKAMHIKTGEPFSPTSTWGFSLLIVYAVWLAVVASLYYPCKWFMGVKQRRKDWWLSYL